MHFHIYAYHYAHVDWEYSTVLYNGSEGFVHHFEWDCDETDEHITRRRTWMTKLETINFVSKHNQVHKTSNY